MTFEEILDQAIALLQRRGRVSYRALKRQFQLEDDYLEDLKTEMHQSPTLGRRRGWRSAGLGEGPRGGGPASRGDLPHIRPV